MPRTVALILFMCAAAALPSFTAARAQPTGGSPSIRRAGTVANLFETLDPSSPIDGVRLTLPDEWNVREIHLLRYGTALVSTRTQTLSDGTVLLTSEHPIRSPHELVVRVQIGERPGLHRWHLTPFVLNASPDTLTPSLQRQFRTLDRRAHTVQVEPAARPSGSNWALDVGRAKGPLQFQLPPPLAPGRDHSFTIEFWLQTSGLNQVVFSSWTGADNAAYPFEFVVDQSGRLRVYCGRSGQHEALRTQAPVADGHWHHAALVYEKRTSRLRLFLDGTRVDSLRPRALPAVSGSLPVALGGRRPSPVDDRGTQQLYTGRLDEVRVWASAKSPATLRTMRTRPFTDPAPTSDGPLRLAFNTSPTEASDGPTLNWPEGARRVPTHLTFQPPLRNFRARTDGQSVTLRWTAQLTRGTTFIVERSRNGETFSVVERLSFSESEPQSGTSRELVYTDENVPGNVVFYRVRQVSTTTDAERSTRTIKIGLGPDASSRAVTLIGNFPNPFKESTTIAYRVRESRSITLTVWDLSGKRVATLAEGTHDPGYYERSLDASDLPSGPYFARLETPQGVQSHRMILLK